ncbi:MAG: hypothetical protein MZV64_59635 [Ignavibacteriales bacterium]|nr:hypothetical protein [Ignavibacteriales bacterium]
MGDAAVKTWTAILAVAVTLALMNFRKSQNRRSCLSAWSCAWDSVSFSTPYMAMTPCSIPPIGSMHCSCLLRSRSEKWADNRWLQAVFVVFLGMVIYNNLELIHQIMTVSLPFYGR